MLNLGLIMALIKSFIAPVKNAIDGLKNNTDDSFANLISVVEGYDVFKATLTEGYFASYNTKTIAALSECNVATLDVTRVVKFKYNYTINIPDARGLFFEDKNGNKLDSYQTLTTVQDITVPEGAVKCYATVLNTEDVVAYEIVGDKPVEILKDQATYTDKDNSGGIKYKWSDDHKTITISGTRTGNSFDGMAGGTSTIPTGMIPGKKYQLVFNPASDKILFGVIVNKDGSQISQKFVNKPTIYKIPEDATGVMVRIIVNGTNAVVNETVNCPEIYTVPETKSIAEQINDLNDAAYGSNTDPLAYIRRDAGLLSVFHKVGCIGDSLASGASAYKEGGVTNYTDNYDFSWGQCLARLTGNTYYNFSAGGLSTRSWLASQKATDCFDGNHTCDAYFIGLGQNDKNNSIPVGTTADINLSDYTQNADTYCGNMGKIIQKVQELQPKAPIFVFIDPLPPSGDQAYNNVIDDIVELFENVWIIDLLTYSKGMFSNSFDVIGSQYRSGHYSAVGYQEIAFVIATYVDWIIRHNLSDFSQVEFIGTNYEWTT